MTNPDPIDRTLALPAGDCPEGMGADVEKMRAELDAVSAAIGSVRFMDPPDGGSVTLAEQVARMRVALEEAEAALSSKHQEGGEAIAAEIYIRDLCPDHVKDYIDGITKARDTALAACERYATEAVHRPAPDEGLRRALEKIANGTGCGDLLNDEEFDVMAAHFQSIARAALASSAHAAPPPSSGLVEALRLADRIVAECQRLAPHYQSRSALDMGRIQILEHFAKWAHDRRAALSSAHTPEETGYRTDIENAPKDGTPVRLLIDYTQREDTDCWFPLEDKDIAWTFGWNQAEDDPEVLDFWRFVGWSWSQDCIVDCRSPDDGKIIGWTPLEKLPIPPAEETER